MTCDFNCFECEYADCREEATMILRHEADIKRKRKYDAKQNFRMGKPIADENTFGYFLRKVRKEHNMGQAELGKMLHVSNNTISLWEMNLTKPRRSKVYQLLEIFPELETILWEYITA